MAVWLSAVPVFAAMATWRLWPRSGRRLRVLLVLACVAALGGSMAVGYVRGRTGNPPGVCATGMTPIDAPTANGTSGRLEAASQPAFAPAADTAGAPALPVLIVYYFHRTIRCPSCLRIEEWAKEAIEGRFANELANGIVEWRAVNIDSPESKHFERDYELTAQSLVLVRMKDGQPAEWKNLKAVWELLGDYGRFTEYVQTEVSSFLGGASGM
jgi:hypothetical protein